MGDEQDSWFKKAFGVDPGQALQEIEKSALAAVNEVKSLGGQAIEGVQQVVSAAAGGVSGAAKKITGSAAPAAGGAEGGGTGSFPLSGSVGSGGNNAANDVRAVQAALSIPVDGQCGQQTIAAIVAFQRAIGQAAPDGRVDAGGTTERALAGGAKAAAPQPEAASAIEAAMGADGAGGLFDGVIQDARDLTGGLQDLGGRLLQGAETPLEDPAAASSPFLGIRLDSDIVADTNAPAPIGTVTMDAPIGVLQLISSSPAGSAGTAFNVEVVTSVKDALLIAAIATGRSVGTVKIVPPGVTLQNAIISSMANTVAGVTAMTIDSAAPRKNPRGPASSTLVMANPIGVLQLVSSSQLNREGSSFAVTVRSSEKDALLLVAVGTGRQVGTVKIVQPSGVVTLQDVLITSLSGSGTSSANVSMTLLSPRAAEIESE